jgi:PAS domain S-box-containing protein
MLRPGHSDMVSMNQAKEFSDLNAIGSARTEAETSFHSAKAGRARFELAQWFLWTAMLAVAVMFVRTCWGFSRLVEPGHSLLAECGLLGLCFALVATAVGAAWHSRNAALKSASLKEDNSRLRQERDLLRAIIDNLPDYIYAKDREGRFILNNPAHAQDLGAKSPKEMRGKTDFDFFPKPLAEQFFADEQKIVATGEPIINQEQFKARPNDPTGAMRWSLSSKVIWRDAHGEILGTVGITRDIHEFKLTQEALRRTEARLQAVLRRTRCILNFGIVEAPEGWREHSLDGKSPFRWHIPVQNVEGAQEVFPVEVPPGKAYQQVWSSCRHPDDFARMNANSGNALLHGLPFYRNEFRCTDKNGFEHWMQEFVTLEKISEDRWQLFGITTDITDLKRSEVALRASEEKLRQSAAQLEQSNRELQDFAYVASHDLQEPLRKIVVFGERLKEKAADALAGDPRDYLERMQKAATRMQSLINDLLTFSRLTTKANPFAPVNLAEIAGQVVEDLESRIEQVQGRVEIGELPVIDAEALQMRQLLQNLISNALKFRKPGVSPVVKVAARTFFNDIGFELCELTVSDNGIGFDEKYLDRIFNVFQRLHSRAEYEGTGMGLAIVRKIALHHGGNITAKSKPGAGATFIVTLPVAHSLDGTIHLTKSVIKQTP